MAKGKMNGGSKSGLLQSGVGVCSYKSNPMSKAAQVKPECGPGGNSDQMKANRLLQKAQVQQDSLRGKSGM